MRGDRHAVMRAQCVKCLEIGLGTDEMMTYSNIAKRLRISSDTVSRIAREEGLKRTIRGRGQYEAMT